MTFPAKLTELLEVAKSPTNEIEDWHCRLQDRQAAMQFLYNHAEAIRDLVVAAEEFKYAGRELAWNCQAMRDAGKKVIEALAKLEEA